jgi:hypothetical protein
MSITKRHYFIGVIMAGIVPAIHDFEPQKDVGARHIGERSDAVLSNG